MQGTVWLVLDLDAKKRGTMEEQLVALAQRLSSEGIRVGMVFSRRPAEFPGEVLRRLGVDVRNLDFHSPESPAILAAWLHHARPDLVHFHFIEPYSAYVAAAKLVGARTLVHDHVVLAPARSLARALVRKARSLALNWMVDRRVAVSEFAARAVAEGHGVTPARVVVVDPDADRAGGLVDVAGARFGADRVAVGHPDRLAEHLADADGLVNASPVGMTG